MRPKKFFRLKPNCLKCNASMEHSAHITVSSLPFHYVIQEGELRKDFGSCGIIVAEAELPPPEMNIKYNYLAYGFNSREPVIKEDGFLTLSAICKCCGQYSYHSFPKSLNSSDEPTKPDFKLSHERYTSPGEFIIVSNAIYNKTQIYIAGTPTIQRLTLEFRPMGGWIVNGSDSEIKNKINKLKLLL